MENKTTTETLRNNVAAARAAFLRASDAVNEIGDRVEAAGGGDTGEETEEGRLLMGLYRAREARLFQALADLNAAQVAARPQLLLFSEAA